MDDSLIYIDIMASTDLPTGTTKKIATDVGDILLANVDGNLYAIDDMCTHEDSSLSLGCLKGDLVSCTLHGSRFNVRTGEPMEEPATQPLRRYPIRVHNDRIEVCLTPKS